MVHADVIVAGAGLAGLVAAAEAADAGKRVLLLDQEGEQNLGGQAFWSLGGLFFIDSPEQRRLGIRDSLALASRDWMTTAGFDRPEDAWPRQWAEAYLDFAAGEKRAWLHAQGMRWFPIVGWAERGGGGTGSAGNSVPRFHLTWGTGPGVLAPFERRVRAHIAAGRITAHFRHRITDVLVSNGVVYGVRGDVLEPTAVLRGQESSRTVVGSFAFNAGAVVISSGGIGGNHDLVRRYWPVERLGAAPRFMVTGVPKHVDGALQQIYRVQRRALRDQLIIRPFPQSAAGKLLWSAYRDDMLNFAGIAIFMFGNKLAGTPPSVAPSDGVLEEFRIAVDKGLKVLPLGFTEYAARTLYDLVAADFAKYFPRATPTFQVLFQQLGDPARPVADQLKATLEALQELERM